MAKTWRLCNEDGKFKPKHQRKEKPAEVGIAYSWWCNFCEGFVITFAEDVFCGEAKCDHCGNKSKLNLADPHPSTPKMPPRKVFDTSDVRVVNTSEY